MLSSFSGFENLPQAVKFLIAFAIIAMLLVLFALVLRRLTGGRLTLNADRGRARQPRLGIVDVYDLDRQRQLILLRRDNVEHLLLVGGPNDVVIETNIVRVPGARLPSTGAENGEKPDAAPERLPEPAPVRPMLDASPSRGAERGADTAPSPLPARAEALPAKVAAPLRATVAARSEQAPRTSGAAGSPLLRTAERSRPAGSQNEAGPPPRPNRGPQTPGQRGAPQPVREGEVVARRSPLSDMARHLGDALKRPSETTGSSSRPAESARPLEAARPPEPVSQEPLPKVPRAEQPASAPKDVSPRQVAEADQAPAASRGDEPAPLPQPPSRGRLPTSPSAETEPAPVAPAPTGPVVEAPAQPSPSPAAAAPEPPPAAPQTAAKPDPFSIEDIEAEFARLLGRPLDRKDK